MNFPLTIKDLLQKKGVNMKGWRWQLILIGSRINLFVKNHVMFFTHLSNILGIWCLVAGFESSSNIIVCGILDIGGSILFYFGLTGFIKNTVRQMRKDKEIDA